MSEYAAKLEDGMVMLVEVVRCRDCRWLDHHNLYLCMLPDGDGGYACWVVEPDGFCKWGERKD